MEKIFFLLIGYFSGCFQSAYILIKQFKKADISKVGSGNPGTANVLLSYGKTLAFFVLMLDMLKAVLPALLCAVIAQKTDVKAAMAICCLGVSLGHNFPFWRKFKGGKGVAVAVATALVVDFRILLFSLLTAAVFSLLLKSATYGSYTFALMIFLCSVAFSHELTVIVCILIQSIMICILHLTRKPKLKRA